MNGDMLLIKLTGIFAGVLARAFFPWIRKLRQGKVKKFNKRYVISAIGSVILGFIITLLIFPKFSVGPAKGGAEAAFKLFATAFGFGFGWHSIVDEAGKWSGAFDNLDNEE